MTPEERKARREARKAAKNPVPEPIPVNHTRAVLEGVFIAAGVGVLYGIAFSLYYLL